MLNLSIISYAMPHLRGRAPYNQVLNMWSFWIMTSAMAFMTFVLTFAGVSEFDAETGPLELHVETLAATLVLRWRQEGPDLYAFDGLGAE